jgi:hypothetical protein
MAVNGRELSLDAQQRKVRAVLKVAFGFRVLGR